MRRVSLASSYSAAREIESVRTPNPRLVPRVDVSESKPDLLGDRIREGFNWKETGFPLSDDDTTGDRDHASAAAAAWIC